MREANTALLIHGFHQYIVVLTYKVTWQDCPNQINKFSLTVLNLNNLFVHRYVFLTSIIKDIETRDAVFFLKMTFQSPLDLAMTRSSWRSLSPSRRIYSWNFSCNKIIDRWVKKKKIKLNQTIYSKARVWCAHRKCLVSTTPKVYRISFKRKIQTV